MIANSIQAKLADGISTYFNNDEINIVFQKAEFSGSVKKHWTKLARVQSWLVELSYDGVPERLSQLLTVLMSYKKRKQKDYNDFLEDLSASLVEEAPYDDSIKKALEISQFASQMNGPPKQKSAASPKSKINITDARKPRKSSVRKSKISIKLGADSLIALQEILNQSVSFESSNPSENRLVLPLKAIVLEQLTVEVDASIKLLGAPNQTKRILWYLKEFRKYLVELKSTVKAATGAGTSILVFIVVMEKCIEAIAKLV
jgi:hypothetical protein